MPSRESPFQSRIFRAGLIAWSLGGILSIVALAGLLLYSVREVLPPIALATALVFLLNPLVERLQRFRIRRGYGTAIIYVAFIGVVVLVMSIIAPVLGGQLVDLADRLPEIAGDLRESSEKFLGRFGLTLEELRLSEAKDGKSLISEYGAKLFAGVGKFASSALHVLVTFVLAPIFAFYILVDLPKLSKTFKHYIPPRHREEVLTLIRRCGEAVGAFFRGQLVVAAIVAIMSSIALLIVGVPFWLAIGLLAGFFNLIPLVGPFVGGGLAVIVGGFTSGLDKAVWAAIAMLIVQQIDNHFISPNVMGRAVRLHPVAVMAALLVGGTLAGLWGMLLSVPTLAVARILAVHYYETRVLNEEPST